MKVVYVVTSDMTTPCGVADYTMHLARSVAELNVRTSVEFLPTWSFGRALQLTKRRQAKDGKAKDRTIYHIQYPSHGMGLSPAAGMLPWMAPTQRIVVTLHEFEIFNPIRKLFFLPFSLQRGVIFTNAYESARFKKFYPWAAESAVIPIGNNIEANKDKAPGEQRRDLIYFGQIAPGKGIEAYLEVVGLLQKSRPTARCAIMGADIDPNSQISRLVRDAEEKLRIEVLRDRSAGEASAQLSRSSVAFLPFPGGVSDKRSSAIACLAHGLAVVTHHSDWTPDWWRKTTYDAANPMEAAKIIERLLNVEGEKTPDPILLARALAEREWSSIAQRHVSFYQKFAFPAADDGHGR